jgi:glycosyltransferase involved in cell wall biosynthesis
MRRLNILVWHIHGSYLDALTSIEHNWYLPVKEGHYGGRRWSSPDYVHEVPWEQVRNLDLDLIIFQSPRNYEQDQYDILTQEQRRQPRIYLEHNTPRPHPVDTRHAVDDPSMLLVHVTQFNRLMWDNNGVPTAVIEHSVCIDSDTRYRGNRERGITMVNRPQHRARIAGLDLYFQAQKQVPLDICGMETEEIGGLGDIKYFRLHRLLAEYRFLYSPMRYTSLPLAVIEAMTVGMPVVALATTELPSVIEDGVNGFISCDPGVLIERMRWLLDHPYEAARMGAAARRTAEARFSLDRFGRDWNAAFARAIEINAAEQAAQPQSEEAVRV